MQLQRGQRPCPCHGDGALRWGPLMPQGLACQPPVGAHKAARPLNALPLGREDGLVLSGQGHGFQGLQLLLGMLCCLLCRLLCRLLRRLLLLGLLGLLGRSLPLLPCLRSLGILAALYCSLGCACGSLAAA